MRGKVQSTHLRHMYAMHVLHVTLIHSGGLHGVKIRAGAMINRVDYDAQCRCGTPQKQCKFLTTRCNRCPDVTCVSHEHESGEN